MNIRGLKSGGFETFRKPIAARPEEDNRLSGPVWSCSGLVIVCGGGGWRNRCRNGPGRYLRSSSRSVQPNDQRYPAQALRVWLGRPLASRTRDSRGEAIDSPFRPNRHGAHAPLEAVHLRGSWSTRQIRTLEGLCRNRG